VHQKRDEVTEEVGCPSMAEKPILMSFLVLTVRLVAGSCQPFAANKSRNDSGSGPVEHRGSGMCSTGEESSDIRFANSNGDLLDMAPSLVLVPSVAASSIWKG